MRLLIVLMTLALLTGCSRQPTAEEIVRNRKPFPTSGKSLGPPPPIIEPAVVASKGACAPKDADNLTVFSACCNDQPCRGQCVRGEDGKTACACYDVKGGCPADKVCSKLRRGCVSPKEAELP